MSRQPEVFDADDRRLLLKLAVGFTLLTLALAAGALVLGLTYRLFIAAAGI